MLYIISPSFVPAQLFLRLLNPLTYRYLCCLWCYGCISVVRLALFFETLEVLLSETFMCRYVCDNCRVFLILKQRPFVIMFPRFPYRNQLSEFTLIISDRTIKTYFLTLRPHDPKFCREFAITSIPSQSIVWMSSSSYSSLTVGRKKTSRPPGLSRCLASNTKSTTRWDNSYGFVGGKYGWSSLEGVISQRIFPRHVSRDI